jgi:hypothetical protein
MRFILAIAALAALATPVGAQQTLAEQVAAAKDVFMGGLTADQFRNGSYYQLLTEGLDGNYIELSGAIDTADAAGIRRQQDALCGTSAFTVTVTPPFGLFITRGADEKIQYTHTGGTSFVPAIDIIGFARANPGMRGSTATDLLKRIGEPVAIWRPSRDVFVITGRDVPDVFVRCGRSAAARPVPVPAPLDLKLPTAPEGGTGAAETPDQLEAALGDVFDSEFGGARPIGRDAFIACALPVLAPLAPGDIDALIASRFVPSAEQRTQLEGDYPDLSAGLAACAEAAQAATE